MYELTMRYSDGSEFPLFIDIDKSVITYKDGVRLDLLSYGTDYNDTHNHKPVAVVNQTTGAKKRKNLTRIRIQLGLKCNYSCSYCMQAVDREFDVRMTTGDVDVFLNRLDEWCDGVKEIEFWGGEPLVYWKKLVPLAEGLRKKYPNVSFKIITNGSLLTEDKVDWLDNLGFGVSISHDGPGQHFRGPDPLEDPKSRAGIIALLKRLGPGRVAFLPVLTMMHHSPAEAVKFFIDATGLEDVQVGLEGMVTPHDPQGIMLSPLTEEDHRKVRRTLFNEFRMPAVFSRGLVQSYLNGLLSQFQRGIPSEARGQNCGMEREDHIAVTLEGKALVCQNVNQDKEIGSVYDFDNINLTHTTTWHNRDECRNCPVVATCAGSCMMVEGEERKRACDNSFTMGVARLALLLFVATGAELVSIKGDKIRYNGITEFMF